MILDKILEKNRADLEARKNKCPAQTLREKISRGAYAIKDVRVALKSTSARPYRIIAEVKKASPSKGVIRENFDPISIAADYELGGADAVSVLTEPHFFQGDLNYLAQIRKNSSLPLLRKDFIVDEYQVLEALAYGADFVLLIAKALSADELKRLLGYANGLGLEALVETHDEEDVEKAIFAKADIIGVNHRNLETFSMDMSLCERLIALMPKDKIIVAESGIYEHSQLIELSKIGVDAFLVGEHFMRQENLQAAVKRLKEG